MLDHDLDPAVARSPEDRALDLALDCWRDRMRSPVGVAPNGYPPTATGVRWRASTDFEDMVETADVVLGDATDACIDGLPPLQREALSTAVLRSRWRHPPMTYAAALLEARRALLRALLARHAITVF
jgi:hypothetical protein